MLDRVLAPYTKWGLLPLRLMIATVFMMHGGQKMFVMGVAGTTRAVTQMGIPLPGVSGPFVMFVEFFGGIALLLGFFSRWAALALAADMAVAVLMVRMRGGFFAPRGAEFEMTLCAACLTLALLGAGEPSIDNSRNRGKA
jgi:putative oxidoreductase